MFRVSEISQKVFAPGAGFKEVKNTQKYRKTAIQKKKKNQLKEKNRLMKRYWKEKWMKTARRDLPWLGFAEEMKTQVKADFDGTMDWVARIALIDSVKICKFEREEQSKDKGVKSIPFDHDEGIRLERKDAVQLITLARFLAERTDDPKIGVGAVIIDKTRIL